MKTTIHIGDRARIEVPDHNPHPGRLWDLFFDDKRVERVIDIRLDGPLNAVGQCFISFRYVPGRVEPDFDVVDYLKEAGWQVELVPATKSVAVDGEGEITTADGADREFLVKDPEQPV